MQQEGQFAGGGIEVELQEGLQAGGVNGDGGIGLGVLEGEMGMEGEQVAKILGGDDEGAANGAAGDIFQDIEEGFLGLGEGEGEGGIDFFEGQDFIADLDGGGEGDFAGAGGGAPLGAEGEDQSGGKGAGGVRLDPAEVVAFGDAGELGGPPQLFLTGGDAFGMIFAADQFDAEGDDMGTDDAPFPAVAAGTMIFHRAIRHHL